MAEITQTNTRLQLKGAHAMNDLKKLVAIDQQLEEQSENGENPDGNGLNNTESGENAAANGQKNAENGEHSAGNGQQNSHENGENA